jgi:DNA-binding NarL/FixJ family response regulator
MNSVTSSALNSHTRHKVFIVDDHPVVRQGLARLLSHEPDLEVCGGTDNLADAVQQIKSLLPDLIVVDISLKDSNGIELITQVKAFNDSIKSLVWSMFDEKIFAERAIRAGAKGYINKQEPVERVLDAVRQVLRGEMYLSPAITRHLLQRLAGSGPLDEDPVARLSDREMQVFHMVGHGVTTQQIARKLGLKPKTVETHREKIKTKLHLRNAAELNCRAVQWVLEHG